MALDTRPILMDTCRVTTADDALSDVSPAQPLPPGPALPAAWQGIALALRPADFLERCALRYGECFTLKIPGFPKQVVFTHPDAVRDIFGADPDDARAGRANKVLEPLLGRHSLLLLDGERHLRERRMMLPPFHGERMKAYFDAIAALTDRAIDSWPIGKPFPIHGEMQRITLDVILRAVFGVDEDEADFGELRALLVRLVSSITNPLLLFPPLQKDLGGWWPWSRFIRLRRRVHDRLLEHITRRRADAENRPDVLSMLIMARDEEGGQLRDDELHDQMLTLLLAGHETTATGLAWAVHRILADDEIRDAILKELRSVVGDGPLDPTHLAELRFLDAATKETLRLHAVVPDVGRALERPARIGDRDLPAGVMAVPSIYLVHRRPDVWPDPERFDPRRFLDARPTAYEFLPFGGGTRRCLGMAFTLYEMKIVLAEILLRLSVHVVDRKVPRVTRRAVTFAPRGGVPVVIEARRS